MPAFNTEAKFIDLLAQIPFQDNSRWILFFPEFPDITLYVESCSVPMYQFEADIITKAITNFLDIGKVTIGFKEDTLGTVQNFLNTLETQVWNRKTRVFKDMQILAKHTALLILDDLAIGVPTIAYRFDDLRYVGTNDLQFAYSGADALKLNANFSVRWIFPMYPKNLMGGNPIP